MHVNIQQAFLQENYHKISSKILMTKNFAFYLLNDFCKKIEQINIICSKNIRNPLRQKLINNASSSVVRIGQIFEYELLCIKDIQSIQFQKLNSLQEIKSTNQDIIKQEDIQFETFSQKKLHLNCKDKEEDNFKTKKASSTSTSLSSQDEKDVSEEDQQKINNESAYITKLSPSYSSQESIQNQQTNLDKTSTSTSKTDKSSSIASRQFEVESKIQQDQQQENQINEFLTSKKKNLVLNKIMLQNELNHKCSNCNLTYSDKLTSLRIYKKKLCCKTCIHIAKLEVCRRWYRRNSVKRLEYQRQRRKSVMKFNSLYKKGRKCYRCRTHFEDKTAHFRIESFNNSEKISIYCHNCEDKIQTNIKKNTHYITESLKEEPIPLIQKETKNLTQNNHTITTESDSICYSDETDAYQKNIEDKQSQQLADSILNDQSSLQCVKCKAVYDKQKGNFHYFKYLQRFNSKCKECDQKCNVLI